MNRFIKKHGISITVIISLIFLVVVLLSSYIIYVFGFYNKLQDNKVFEYYNTFNFDDLYYYMDIKNDKYMNKKTFQGIVNTMYNKLTLQQIYNSYYANSGKYKNMDSFVSEFYYGYGEINKNDFDIKYKGKTNLIKRRKLIVEGVKVKSAQDKYSYLGTIKNLTFIIESNASIKIDDIDVKCENNNCNIDYLFGGIHQLKYTSGNFIYYSIINIDKDDMVININSLSNLVSIDTKKDDKDDGFDAVNNDTNSSLINGLYALVECTSVSGCPSLDSYVSVNVDGTITYTRYYGDSVSNYVGTYDIYNGFINIVFTKVNDREISEKVTFKINSDGSFSNESYRFIKKA